MAKQDKKSAQKNRPGNATIKENPYFESGAVAALLIMVFLAASYKISGDDDFFWHLATGRFVVENHYVPDKDVFGFTSSNDEWIPFEWGWDVLTYGLYNIGGYNTILAFRSLSFSFIFLLLYLLLRKLKVNWFISVLLLFMLSVGIMDRYSPRPHIISYIFFVTISYLLLSFRYVDREKYFKRLYYLPLIFLIWGNSHMGVLAGGLFLFIFTASETIIFLKPKTFSTGDVKPLEKDKVIRLFIISLVCAIVLLINPHGLSTYIYAYSHTKMKMLETVNEWRNPFTGTMDFGFVVTVYKMFLFAGFVVLLYSFAKKDLFFGLAILGFAIYSVRAIRFTVDYEILMLPLLGVSLNHYLSKVTSDNSKSFTYRVLASPVPKVVFFVFFLYVSSLIPSNKIYDTLKYYRVSGWGINDEFIPVQLFDFIKATNIAGTPFNQFGTGGYMVWNFPGQKNFIDSRNLNDRLFYEYDNIMSMRPGFEKKLEQYGIDFVIYLDPDLIRRPAELNGVVTAYLNKSSDWKLVFWDDKSLLYLKNIPKFSDVINKYEYKVLNPYSALFNKNDFISKVKGDVKKTKEELKRKQEAEPKGYLFNGMNEMAGRYLTGQ